MKPFIPAVITVCLSVAAVPGATLDDHPHWKSDRLPDFYYEVLIASVDNAARFQAPDGRFRSRIPANSDEDVRSFSMYGMQYIYVPALLYASDHAANTRRGDDKLLRMAVAAGDYMASIVDPGGNFEPVVDGKKVSSLDSHRSLYCWAEAYGLIGDRLDKKRQAIWRDALIRAGGKLYRDLVPRIDRPRYTAPFIGTSPNHYGLWATTVWRIGMIFGREDWVAGAGEVLGRFVREVSPGGYWAEHDGPMVSYDYLNVSVAGLYWHYAFDPAALGAIRANTDFHLHWHTPDGVDISTIDERNRSHFRPGADWGLFAFSHFPEGRRLARFKLLAALGDGADPLESLGLAALGRIAQDAHYHKDGPEAPLPQEATSYRHVLDRPAVVKKSGPWVYSMSAVVSPPSPYNQFFLDRICPISLWHGKCRHIIGGGNSKGQPELATFAVKRSGADSWDYMPLDALIRGDAASDTICVAHEGYSLRLTIQPEDDSRAVIAARAEATYGSRDSVVFHLPLRLLLGGELSDGSGKSYAVGEEEIRLDFRRGGAISHNYWKLVLPAGAGFIWPYYTYSPYGPTRVPKNIHDAMGVVTVPLDPEAGWVRVGVEVQ